MEYGLKTADNTSKLQLQYSMSTLSTTAYLLVELTSRVFT